jgi:hypothetical protein
MAYIDQRVRLKLDVKVTDNTSARIHLEHNSTWGEGYKDNAQGLYPVGNYWENDNLNFVEAWINHNFGSFGLKLGHMPLALGNKLFFDHTKEGDDAIVIYGSTNNIHWAGVVAKFNEGDKGSNDDATAYVILANYKGDGFNLGADITYVNDETGSGLGDSLDGYNLGLRGDFNVSGITIKADVELQAGSVDNSSGAVCPAGKDCDFKGYAFMLSAGYNLGKTNLELKFAYGSGDDNANDTDIKTFITSLSDTQYDTYIYGYRMKNTSVSPTVGATQSGISNLMLLGLKASNKVTKDLKVDGGIFWLQAAKDVKINGGKPDKDLGIEIDAKVTYNLDRNLKYWVEGGYFMVGDAYNDVNGNADDVYSIRNGIQLSF